METDYLELYPADLRDGDRVIAEEIRNPAGYPEWRDVTSPYTISEFEKYSKKVPGVLGKVKGVRYILTRDDGYITESRELADHKKYKVIRTNQE